LEYNNTLANLKQGIDKLKAIKTEFSDESKQGEIPSVIIIPNTSLKKIPGRVRLICSSCPNGTSCHDPCEIEDLSADVHRCECISELHVGKYVWKSMLEALSIPASVFVTLGIGIRGAGTGFMAGAVAVGSAIFGDLLAGSPASLLAGILSTGTISAAAVLSSPVLIGAVGVMAGFSAVGLVSGLVSGVKDGKKAKEFIEAEAKDIEIYRCCKCKHFSFDHQFVDQFHYQSEIKLTLQKKNLEEIEENLTQFFAKENEVKTKIDELKNGQKQT